MENGNPRRDVSVGAKSGVKDFTARAFRKNIYLACRGFPKQETFELSSQMRRAAVSVTANLAEGYGRFSYQENMQFCRQSRGSVYELRDHLTTALDAVYITQEQYKQYESQATSVIKLINGYIRSTKQRKLEADTAHNEPQAFRTIFYSIFYFRLSVNTARVVQVGPAFLTYFLFSIFYFRFS
jgi:four helix bundle protein